MKAPALIVLALLCGAATASVEPGGVQIASKGGRNLHIEADGYADLENHVLMSKDAAFRIASLTKQFTAAAVLRLVEDGLLGLDDKLERRLPHCPHAWRDITIRELLSHTSGLSGDLAPLMPFANADLTPRQVLDVFSEVPPAATPGERFEYANLNYWILGLVIEAASGAAYSDYVDRAVLAPAGLKATRYGDHATIIRHRVRGYAKTAAGAFINARHFSTTIGYSAGGYVSIASDIARWYAALGEGRIIGRRLLDEALMPARLASGEPIAYGLGWRLSTCGDEPLAHHGGTTFGFRSYVYWRPGSGEMAAVLMNSEGEEPSDKALSLLKPACCPSPE